MVGILNNTVPCNSGVSEALGDDSSWYGEWFYVNMFFRDKEAQFPIDEEK